MEGVTCLGRKTQMNSLTSPELLEQVNPENKELLQEFLDYLRSTQRSEGTISGYQHDINIAFVWALQHNNNLPFVEWKKRHIVKYQNWLLNENKNSPARVRRLKASLSSMANFVENILDEDYPNFRNIVRKIEDPANNPVREPSIWTDEELQELLDKLIDQKKYKQACYLALGIYSGRRKSELCRFKVSDFDDDKLVCGGALYKSSPIKTKGRGGGKYIPCYTLVKGFNPYLKLWLDKRKSLGIDSQWLFPKQNGASGKDEHIEVSTANSWASSFDKMSDKPFYPHLLRHAFTTRLYKAGIPESVIQALQNWESIDMVSVYLDCSVDEQIEMYFKDGDIAPRSQKGLNDL